MLLLGIALRQVLSQPSTTDLNDGSAVAPHSCNRTFALDTETIEFDEVGERLQRLIVQQIRGGIKWPVTVLRLKVTNENFIDSTSTKWIAAFSPPNEPLCELQGIRNSCQPGT
ncbi:hypothetical protein RvY_16481 [Ramazzottius varieornatus]|uniref:Uncharacterized protein n=1 Tax=Ramazzottius varieornatus TaxID=947166 RepID=A0A1D1VZX6_RAMVA|nr:hypothetical protein RvY_16481 [Ramazzottius varieornatus]